MNIIGTWKMLRIFPTKASRFFLVLVLFWTFFVIFGLNTEFVPEFSGVYHLFHMKLEE
jgi:hypothetical protein